MPYGSRKAGGKGYQSHAKKTTKKSAKKTGNMGQRKTYSHTGKAPGQGTKKKHNPY